MYFANRISSSWSRRMRYPLQQMARRGFVQCTTKLHAPLLSRICPSTRPTLAQSNSALHKSILLYPRTASTSSNPPKKTPLYDLHVKHGGKMVPFAGYDMPIQYSDLGIGESHLWTREKSSLFDVGHMVQHTLTGSGAKGLLERLTPASPGSLQMYHGGLSCFLHPKTGGIVDDTIISRIAPEGYYIVTNAGCREKDLAYLEENIKKWHDEGNAQVNWTVLEDKGLIALQGPFSMELLETLLEDRSFDLKSLHFGQCTHLKLRLQSGTTSLALISRGGYTGEDGFEISLDAADTVPFVEFLLQTAGTDKLRLAGLGARDSLRLEAGMCLYGHDLDDSTTPVEGGLSWVIAPDRRKDPTFYGGDVILQQLTPKKDGGTGVSKRRVGLVVEGAPAREGAEIVDDKGNVIGKVTSGCPSPTLKKNIAMGYVKSGFNKAGTELGVIVRGKQRKATVSKMPFVPSKYWKGGITPG